MPHDPADIINHAFDGFIPTAEPTEEQLHRAREADQARVRALEARVKHLEQALKTAGRVLEPYLASRRR